MKRSRRPRASQWARERRSPATDGGGGGRWSESSEGFNKQCLRKNTTKDTDDGVTEGARRHRIARWEIQWMDVRRAREVKMGWGFVGMLRHEWNTPESFGRSASQRARKKEGKKNNHDEQPGTAVVQ